MVIQGSDSEFRELWFVSAVCAVGKVFGLIGFELTEDFVGVETSFEMLEKFLTFLIFQ